MRKLSIILTVLSLLLICGCSTVDNENAIASEAVVQMPADDSVNGYRKSQASHNTESSQSASKSDELLYYANKNSKIFHLSTCGTAKRIKNENLYITADRAELILEDYKPCSNCKP